MGQQAPLGKIWCLNPVMVFICSLASLHLLIWLEVTPRLLLEFPKMPRKVTVVTRIDIDSFDAFFTAPTHVEVYHSNLLAVEHQVEDVTFEVTHSYLHQENSSVAVSGSYSPPPCSCPLDLVFCCPRAWGSSCFLPLSDSFINHREGWKSLCSIAHFQPSLAIWISGHWTCTRTRVSE
jgi:hypothetical protein